MKHNEFNISAIRGVENNINRTAVIGVVRAEPCSDRHKEGTVYMKSHTKKRLDKADCSVTYTGGVQGRVTAVEINGRILGPAVGDVPLFSATDDDAGQRAAETVRQLRAHLPFTAERACPPTSPTVFQSNDSIIFSTAVNL